MHMRQTYFNSHDSIQTRFIQSIYATVPKHKSKKREIWTAETLMHALEVCDNDRLRLSLNLSFSCSLRIGELLGLTWDCIDISPEAIEENRAYVYVNKEASLLATAACTAEVSGLKRDLGWAEEELGLMKRQLEENKGK